MLAARSLRVRRGARSILHDISIDLHAGEVMAIVGPNGAGKSTFLGALSGEIPLAGGSVSFAGRPLAAMSIAELARCRAILPQQSTLAFPFAVGEVVLLGRMPFNGGIARGRDREIADDAMRLTGTLHLRERPYTTLSGGERQRVQLARVLTQIAAEEKGEERCLFLDEPTSSLDLAHQHGTLEIARRMAAGGCGVMAVLHDLNLAAAYADRVAILHDGGIVALGSPAEVLTPEAIGHAFGITASIIPHPHLTVPVVIAGGAAYTADNGSTSNPINYHSLS